jgi:hypothetical protein
VAVAEPTLDTPAGLTDAVPDSEVVPGAEAIVAPVKVEVPSAFRTSVPTALVVEAPLSVTDCDTFSVVDPTADVLDAPVSVTV